MEMVAWCPFGTIGSWAGRGFFRFKHFSFALLSQELGAVSLLPLSQRTLFEGQIAGALSADRSNRGLRSTFVLLLTRLFHFSPVLYSEVINFGPQARGRGEPFHPNEPF